MKVETNLNELVNYHLNPLISEVIINFVQHEFELKNSKHGDKKQLSENVSVVFLSSEIPFDKIDILEAHRQNIDLHYTISGIDKMAYKNVDECKTIEKEYDADNDYLLVKELPSDVQEIHPCNYAIIPPSLAHMAFYQTTSKVEKLVFKIKVN
ncbi:MAG: hypothetical protein RJA07_2032 [Bacteroidota bacterium]|jgi:beta-galactosidase beta subunit